MVRAAAPAAATSSLLLLLKERAIHPQREFILALVEDDRHELTAAISIHLVGALVRAVARAARQASAWGLRGGLEPSLDSKSQYASENLR